MYGFSPDFNPSGIINICLMCKKCCKNTSALTKHTMKCLSITNTMWAEIKLLQQKIEDGDDTEETKNKCDRLENKHKLLTDYADIMSIPGRKCKKTIANLPYQSWKFITCNRPGSHKDRAVHMWDWFYITPEDEYNEAFDEIIDDLRDMW